MALYDSLMVCLLDFERYFSLSLDKNALDYYSAGANHEQTLRDNVEAFSRLDHAPLLENQPCMKSS